MRWGDPWVASALCKTAHITQRALGLNGPVLFQASALYFNPIFMLCSGDKTGIIKYQHFIDFQIQQTSFVFVSAPRYMKHVYG